MKEALFYSKLENLQVRCELCPHLCTLSNGSTGNCRVRKNIGGVLFSENYGKISGYHLDPIEKKPLYHFYPGKKILSIGSFGCNMHCTFCQNHEISQCGASSVRSLELSPDSVVNDALRKAENIGVAFTYNEPFVFYEFMRDTALLVRQYGLKNVMVSNGFFNEGPLQKMLVFIDAFSIDLKAFTNEFYKKYTSSAIDAVKDSLIAIKKSGKHLEITNLVIPGLNDNRPAFEAMVGWIRNMLGRDTILHISRYFPRYKMTISPTDEQTLQELYSLASKALDYVYIGNMHGAKGQDTYCPNCGHKVVSRNGYQTNTSGLTNEGNCLHCSQKLFVYHKN
jgi:pyruvate formate lyase activating enzyme